MERYAMVITNANIRSNGDKPEMFQVVAGEVVKVIRVVGNVAIIRPYNKRRLYLINNRLLNFNISQDKRKYCVDFGVRRLIS